MEVRSDPELQHYGGEHGLTNTVTAIGAEELLFMLGGETTGANHVLPSVGAVLCKGSDVLQILLDGPQGISALPQLGNLFLCQPHVDDAAHAAAVQHARQRQEDLLADAVHILSENRQAHVRRCGQGLSTSTGAVTPGRKSWSQHLANQSHCLLCD